MPRIPYKGWPNCFRMANKHVELIVTADVGPRILRFGFANGDNEFAEYESMLGMTGGDEWRIYGGHRLWHAPESVPRTYAPDNAPVTVEDRAGLLHVVQRVEETTGIQKELEIVLSPERAHCQVTHRLWNRNLWAVELAPWAISTMAPGGASIVPLPPRGPHPQNLAPVSTITLWAFTNMADARWTWGGKYIMLRQDPAATTPQEAAFMVPDGWVAYAHAGHLFVKTFRFVAGARYPQMGACVETFTNADMLEVETLGPLVSLPPGDCIEHVEQWFLFDGVPAPHTDADIESHILPLVRSVLP
jgi:hypothetical protein